MDTAAPATSPDMALDAAVSDFPGDALLSPALAEGMTAAAVA